MAGPQRNIRLPLARPQTERGPDPAILRKNVEQDIERLAADVQRLRIEFQRFLAGDVAIPPEELRDRITSELRRLRASNLKATADNFRLNSIESQFNSYLELYGRRMRKLEEGAERRRSAGADAAPDAEKGVVVGPGLDDQAVNVLYKGLYLKSGTRNPTMDLERFRTFLGRQAEAIRAKTGCQEILFRVAVDEGQLKLKAKPVRGETT